MSTATLQAARYNMRLRRRGRQFASALTVHAAGLTVVGVDQFDGNLTSGAMFVQNGVGLPWVALTSGTTGSTPLTGNGVINDGGVTWLQWGGVIRVAPPTP
jgi:hypothetical protein